MKMSREFQGSGPDLAFAYADAKYWPKVETVPALVQIERLINSHLTNGGSVPMNVNGSVTPVTFQFVVPADKYFALAQLTLVIVDSGITPLNFGGIAALSNGILIYATDENDVVQYNFHAGSAIKQNFEFYHVNGSRITTGSGQSGDTLTVVWSSDLVGFYPTLKPGWKLKVVVRDNLTGLDKFESGCAGVYIAPDLLFST